MQSVCDKHFEKIFVRKLCFAMCIVTTHFDYRREQNAIGLVLGR